MSTGLQLSDKHISDVLVTRMNYCVCVCECGVNVSAMQTDLATREITPKDNVCEFSRREIPGNSTEPVCFHYDAGRSRVPAGEL